jgi:hypothetical protein
MVGFPSLNPPYEPVNLSIFSIPDLSQIKDLADVKSAKTGTIHILYEADAEVATYMEAIGRQAAGVTSGRLRLSRLAP